MDLTDAFAAAQGAWAHALARDLWPVARSLSGPGVRQTLQRLQQDMPDLRIEQIASGTQVFDWTVPDEWTLRRAYIEDANGRRIVDTDNTNLHVVGYSEPVDVTLSRAELDAHLYSLPDQPDAVPYVTSYYKRRWGFCLPHTLRQSLPDGPYRAVVDADLRPGVLNYGELVIPRASKREIFLSTYVCHPSMANNELSGPVVTAALARWAATQGLHHTLRVVFIPETIGSLIYLSRHLPALQETMVAGFNVTCIGDDRTYSFLPSRAGDTRADQAARHVLRHMAPDHDRYTWLDRGSDERQYCAPGVDLPVATLMRSKYGEYPEYHTSLDDLDTVVTPSGLAGGFLALARAIAAVDQDVTLQVTTLGEPQLGKRGLYPDVSVKGSAQDVRRMMNLISYCDGAHSLLDIADKIDAPVWDLHALAAPLVAQGLLRNKRSA
ncbi:MAG: DUF4910 domain-containing protein [Pseudomonadota bacterium]